MAMDNSITGAAFEHIKAVQSNVFPIQQSSLEDYSAQFKTEPMSFEKLISSPTTRDQRQFLSHRNSSVPVTKPRLLVCHDMRGNYLEDKYHIGANYENAFQLFHWDVIDIFCYFSHNFITIPPLSWTNACRQHQTLVLGTVITEWDKGKEICSYFFSSIHAMEVLIAALIEIAVKSGLDGWLINIENTLEAIEVDNMQIFLSELTRRMREINRNSLVLWCVIQ